MSAAPDLLKVFAYGFGFGNPIMAFLGDKGDDVRDLIQLPGRPQATVSITELAAEWELYREHVENLLFKALGQTPMKAGFETVRDRMLAERSNSSYFETAILFVLSDGEPTDGSPEDILAIADEIKSDNTIIISCYMTDADIAEPRRLYSTSSEDWPPAAELMFKCASILPRNSAFDAYIREFGWQIEPDSRLFAQINHSVVLSEFMRMVLSPFEQAQEGLQLANDFEVGRNRVFVSYSHQDSEWLKRLRIHLSPLETQGVVDIWDDTKIAAGADWKLEIERALDSAQVAVLLVSADFLASRFISDKEVPELLAAAESKGTTILPVIISPSLFHDIESLSRYQTVNASARPLTAMTRDEQEGLFVKLAQDIIRAVNNS